MSQVISRVRVALVLLVAVGVSLAVPTLARAETAAIDQSGWAAEHHAALIKIFPDAKAHIFPELGHNPNFEQPAEVAAQIAEFLEAHP